MTPYYIYILRCADGSLYTGVTTDPARRFSEHAGRGGRGAKYTASHRPVRLEAAWSAPGRAAALRLEYRLKALPRAEKERLICGGTPDDSGILAQYARVLLTDTGRVIPMLFLCHPKCTTCARARAFLDTRGAPYELRDIRLTRPSQAELRAWHALSGLPLRRFFNTSGRQYRALQLAERLPSMTQDEQYALLASDGMLVRRPILICGDTVLVGFRQSEWEAAL